MSRRHRFTDAELEWLADGYRRLRLHELVERFNDRFSASLSVSTIKSALTRRGIRSGLGPGLRPGERPSRIWTEERIDWLRQHRASADIKEITARFNSRFGTRFRPHSLHNVCQKNGIRAAKTGRFDAGHEPWNKGQPHPSTGRAVDTQFKPGSRPRTWVPIGSQRVNQGRLEQKIADHPPGQAYKNWRPVCRIAWEAANGPLPAGQLILLIDPDLNRSADLGNMVVVTRAELARLNQAGWGQLDTPELRAAAIAEAKLRQQAHEAGKRAGLDYRGRRALIGSGWSFLRRER